MQGNQSVSACMYAPQNVLLTLKLIETAVDKPVWIGCLPVIIALRVGVHMGCT